MNILGNDYMCNGEGLSSCKRDVSAYADTIGYFDCCHQDLQFVAATIVDDGKKLRFTEYGRDAFQSVDLSPHHDSFMGICAGKAVIKDFSSSLVKESLESIGGFLSYRDQLFYAAPSVPYRLYDRAGARSRYAGRPSVIRMWSVMYDLYETPGDKVRCIFRRTSFPGQALRCRAKIYNICSSLYKIHNPLYLYHAAESLAFGYKDAAVTYTVRSDDVRIRVEIPSLGGQGIIPGIEYYTCITGESGTLVRATLRREGCAESAIFVQTSFSHDADITAEDIIGAADSHIDKLCSFFDAALTGTVSKAQFTDAVNISRLPVAIGKPALKKYLGNASSVFADDEPSDICDAVRYSLSSADYAGAVAPSHADRVRTASGALVKALII